MVAVNVNILPLQAGYVDMMLVTIGAVLTLIVVLLGAEEQPFIVTDTL